MKRTPFQWKDTVPVYRFFHTQTGNHFYTANEQEKLDIIANQSPPYNFEGIKWYVDRPTVSTEFTPPVDQVLGSCKHHRSLILDYNHCFGFLIVERARVLLKTVKFF